MKRLEEEEGGRGPGVTYFPLLLLRLCFLAGIPATATFMFFCCLPLLPAVAFGAGVHSNG